jgi:hypothetical protein
MPYLALVLVAVVVLVLLARAFVAANPAALAQGLRWAGLGVAALGVGALLLRGQVWLAGFLLPIVVGLWQGRRPSWFGGGASSARPTPGQASSIRTDFLELTLDHDSGALTGDVLRGRQRGRRVETLGQAELLALRQETITDDPASTPLVETVLDRAFPDWRDAAEAAAGPGPGATAAPRAGAMSREEALRILGLSGDPSPDAVVEAHRRLMMAHHPDRGGSAYLAALINEAKSVLTGTR